MALLRGIELLRDELCLVPLAVHVDHQLRGLESERDAVWVRELCDALGIPCEVVTVDVLRQSEQRGIGVEEAARDARYAALQAAAEQHGCETIALAHTADDQAETVLHHVLRGTGLAGLRGMPPKRALTERLQVVRPLLSVWRTEIEQFLQALGQEFREDSSNRDTSLTRNFLRQELLRLLERRMNPQVREHLVALAQQAMDWQEALQFQATELLDAALLDESNACVRLRAAAFAGQPRHVVRESFVLLWSRREWSRQSMTFAHWDKLADLTQSEQAAVFNLPGNKFARRRGQLIVVET